MTASESQMPWLLGIRRISEHDTAAGVVTSPAATATAVTGSIGRRVVHSVVDLADLRTPALPFPVGHVQHLVMAPAEMVGHERDLLVEAVRLVQPDYSAGFPDSDSSLSFDSVPAARISAASNPGDSAAPTLPMSPPALTGPASTPAEPIPPVALSVVT